jgi:hypothetical protein
VVSACYDTEACSLLRRLEPSETAIQQHVVDDLQTAHYEERRAGGVSTCSRCSDPRVHDRALLVFRIARHPHHRVSTRASEY